MEGGLAVAVGVLTLAGLSALAPTAAAQERPTDWTCDPSGVLVCAGANVGADVGCQQTADGAVCEWTFGQTLGGESPSGLPREAEFSWSSSIETCVSDGTIATCSDAGGGGSTTCSWGPAMACIENLGPNPGSTDPVTLEEGECLSVTIELSANSQAFTPSASSNLAQAEHAATGSDAGKVCNLNQGR